MATPNGNHPRQNLRYGSGAQSGDDHAGCGENALRPRPGSAAGGSASLGDVIDFYNKATAELPDHTKLKGIKLPGASVVLDRKGERFAEVFEENQRRVWVPLADIPEHVQKAFLAAEDKRFYQHKGIDERGLIRAFIGNLASSARPLSDRKSTRLNSSHIAVSRMPSSA